LGARTVPNVRAKKEAPFTSDQKKPSGGGTASRPLFEEGEEGGDCDQKY